MIKLSTSENPVLTSEAEDKHELNLTFSRGKVDGFLPAKNIFIYVNTPGIFPTGTLNAGTLSTRFNCREHYEKQGFDIVDISYSQENGLQIHAYKDNKMQELLVPERYIVCVGIDYEPEQPE